MATSQFPDRELQEIQLQTLLWQEIVLVIRKCSICEDPADINSVLLLLNMFSWPIFQQKPISSTRMDLNA